MGLSHTLPLASHLTQIVRFRSKFVTGARESKPIQQ